MHKYYGKGSNHNEFREKDKYIIKIIIKSRNSTYLATEEWKRDASWTNTEKLSYVIYKLFITKTFF